jgi:hypothetical protein
MQSKATTVASYLKELPADRRAIVAAVRKVVNANLDADFEEGMGYGMISWHVPHRVYPPGYHCNPKLPLPFAALASQKNYLSLYLLSIYAEKDEEDWLRKRFAAAGKKLDMGKCCVRFKSLDDLPLDVIGEAIGRVSVAEHVAHYERARAAQAKAGPARGARSAKSSPRKA